MEPSNTGKHAHHEALLARILLSKKLSGLSESDGDHTIIDFFAERISALVAVEHKTYIDDANLEKKLMYAIQGHLTFNNNKPNRTT